jgi:hypothetical protein
MEIGDRAFRAADDRFVEALLSAGKPPGAPPGDQPSAASATPEDHVLRGVRPVSLAAITPGSADTAVPTFEWIDPGTLLIDDGYQRNLSDRSARLIRKICAAWDWRRFKPPVCARTERGLEIIDGQHTAIAACSHPDVHTIPIMVVVAAGRADRAQAFIGQNRDRLNITPMQMHYAAAAAGDEDAQTIDQVCARAGVTVLKSTPGNGVWRIGDTVAVTGIGALINRRGAMRAREILQILVAGRCRPVSTGQIKAVELLLFGDEYREDIDGEGITNALLALGEDADREAAVFAAAHRVPLWRALAIVLFRKGKRRARRATAN